MLLPILINDKIDIPAHFAARGTDFKKIEPKKLKFFALKKAA
jgi:hypothetical protein